MPILSRVPTQNVLSSAREDALPFYYFLLQFRNSIGWVLFKNFEDVIYTMFAFMVHSHFIFPSSPPTQISPDPNLEKASQSSRHSHPHSIPTTKTRKVPQRSRRCPLRQCFRSHRRWCRRLRRNYPDLDPTSLNRTNTFVLVSIAGSDSSVVLWCSLRGANRGRGVRRLRDDWLGSSF